MPHVQQAFCSAIFAGAGENQDIREYLNSFGFEVEVMEVDPDGTFWTDQGTKSPGIEVPSPEEVGPGFHLIGAWDAADGPVCWYVRPRTSVARALLTAIGGIPVEGAAWHPGEESSPGPYSGT